MKVLITGASGLIGQKLTAILEDRGFGVNVLGRSKSTGKNRFVWDIDKGEMDERALEGVNAIIHLAGAGVADKRWTTARKQEIINSRVKSAGLLNSFLKKGKHSVDTFISASAVGYYGDCGGAIVTEDSKRGDGFLAEVCGQWERSAIKIGSLGIREVRCRIGIVLAADGGALPELTRTIPFGFASYFAKNELYYPWVHLDDVCGIMVHALANKWMKGAYNTTAPQPLLMKDLMQQILKVKQSKAILVPAPAVGVKLALGEMSEMLLSSQRCSAQKVLDAGYTFKFGNIEKALRDVYP
jgi:uncharacterized protein